MNVGKISLKLLRKISEKLAKHNYQPIRCLSSTRSSKPKEIPDMSPIKKVPLFPGGDDNDRNRLELFPVFSTLADQPPSVTTILQDSMSGENIIRLLRRPGVQGFEERQLKNALYLGDTFLCCPWRLFMVTLDI